MEDIKKLGFEGMGELRGGAKKPQSKQKKLHEKGTEARDCKTAVEGRRKSEQEESK